MASLPTMRDEAWRYADFEAVRALAPERFAEWKDVALVPGEVRQHCTVLDDQWSGLNRVRIDIAKGARAEMFAVISAGSYTRLEVEVRLGPGAHFEFGAVTIGGGAVVTGLATLF